MAQRSWKVALGAGLAALAALGLSAPGGPPAETGALDVPTHTSSAVDGPAALDPTAIGAGAGEVGSSWTRQATQAAADAARTGTVEAAAKPVLRSAAEVSELRATLAALDACGPGLRAVVTRTYGFSGCVHAVGDPLPPTRVSAASAAKVTPTCYGNGVNGDRVELLYAYAEGRPNRIAEVTPLILGEIVPKMEAVVRTYSTERGKPLGIRFHAPGCTISLTAIQVSADAAAADEDQFDQVMDELMAAGYDADDRKYLIWLDGPAVGYCGIATMFRGASNDAVSAVQNGLHDNPTPLNTNAMIRLGSNYAMVVQSGAGAASYGEATGTDSCWGRGTSGAVTELHELWHTLGAVQVSAPNSNGLGHCTDVVDIMCYSEGGIQVVKRCFASTEVLDCNGDDYFNPSPPIGSYLSTHHNTANSTFLGEQPQDLVPVELPRL